MNTIINNSTTVNESLPLLLSAKHVEQLGISRSMFYRLIHRTDVPTVTLGARIYINRDQFLKWIDDNTEKI